MVNPTQTSADGVLAVRIPEAARRVGLGRSTLYEHIASGDLRSFRVGRSRLIRVADLDDWVRRHATIDADVA